MTLDQILTIVAGVVTTTGGAFWMIRKAFVNWSKENVTVQGADATSAMMANFKSEINRLAESNKTLESSNKELADENRALQKQINRLEIILQKIAAKFDVDLEELHKEIPHV